MNKTMKICGAILFLVLINVCFGIIDHLQIKECKHGTFLLSSFDSCISRHLLAYGEWAEKELDLFLQIVKTGDIVLDVGANIGAFTVPLAKAVGPFGRVYAFEPQRIISQRLSANVALNDLSNVFVYQAAVGQQHSYINVPKINYSVPANYGAISLADQILIEEVLHETAQVITLDSLDFKQQGSKSDCPSLIKIDVELMERYVLIGARNLIARCKPILYVENNCMMTSGPLVSLLYELDYVPYWDLTFAKDDIKSYDINMICLHQSHIRKETEATGHVSMIGYVVVELDKPYLHMYFSGQHHQSGNESTCIDVNTYS